MTRWMIEKSGTGIEKSGTGIEKDGTGIEKSGTGIEKSGTGIRKSLLALSMASIAFASQLSANELQPEGTLSVVVQNDSLLVSWIIDGSIFSGVTALSGTSANLLLTEVSLASNDQFLETTGGGTGSKINTTGGGTGIETTGGGTGIETTGGGTGIETTGGGTGIQTTGGGTGYESIVITSPADTGLEMEITLDCQTAYVSVLDSNYTEVISFNDINVMGDTGLCEPDGNEIEPVFGKNPY